MVVHECVVNAKKLKRWFEKLLKIIKNFPKKARNKAKVDFFRNFKCKHAFLLDPSE